jgi:hypothetical protein
VLLSMISRLEHGFMSASPTLMAGTDDHVLVAT